MNVEILSKYHHKSHPIQIICDIDKTYLETNYETLRGMAQIMLESAADKKTVNGAREFLRALKFQDHPPICVHGKTIPLHFVSSSPPQLRAVLEHKMAMDHLICASHSFKDQIYNLKKAKLSLLKHQVPYKLAAILSICDTCTNLKHLILIGDNAESDPYIYTLVKAIITNRISKPHIIQCLKYLDVPEETTTEILTKLTLFAKKHPPQVIIAIRKAYDLKQDPSPLDDDIFWFNHYWNLAITFYHLGFLKAPAIRQFIQESILFSQLSCHWAWSRWQDYRNSSLGANEYSLDPTHSDQHPHPQDPLKELFSTLISHHPEDMPLMDSPFIMAHDPHLAPDDFCEQFDIWIQSHLRHMKKT